MLINGIYSNRLKWSLCERFLLGFLSFPEEVFAPSPEPPTRPIWALLYPLDKHYERIRSNSILTDILFFISDITDILPQLKIPKLKKLRRWTGGSLANLSQMTNNFHSWKSSNTTAPESRAHGAPHLPPKNSTLSNFQATQYPTGISTISSSVTQLSPSQRDNCGLYALKCDRNAAKRGILLTLPHQIIQYGHPQNDSAAGGIVVVQPRPRNMEMKHEKFSPCHKRSTTVGTTSRLSLPAPRHQDTYDDDDESEEYVRVCVEPPPRRLKRKKRKSPAPPISPMRPFTSGARELEPVKNRSELFRISDSSNRPAKSPPKVQDKKKIVLKFPKIGKFRKDKHSGSAGSAGSGSVDIFNKEPDFNEFDSIFKGRKDKLKKSVKLNEQVTVIKAEEELAGVTRQASDETVTCEMSYSEDERIKTCIKTQDYYSKRLPRCSNVSTSPSSARQSIGIGAQTRQNPYSMERKASPEPAPRRIRGRSSSPPSDDYHPTRSDAIRTISSAISLADRQSTHSLDSSFGETRGISSNVRRKIMYYNDEDISVNNNNSLNPNLHTNDINNLVLPVNVYENNNNFYCNNTINEYERVPVRSDNYKFKSANQKCEENQKVLTLRRSINSNEYYEDDEDEESDANDADEGRRKDQRVVGGSMRPEHFSIHHNNSADEGIYI